MRARTPSFAWRSGFWIVAAASLPSLGLAAGCHHHDDVPPPEEACTASPTLPAVQALFTSTCAGSSCHGSGPSAVFPPLAEGDPSAWLGAQSHEQAGQPLVVPGHPEQSYIYMKVSGTQGASGGALMPLGSATPNQHAVTAIHDWIAAGAPGSCSGDDAGAPPPSTDPNTLDQAQLFTCPAGAPPASSPARIRRIDSPEWTYAIPQPLNSPASQNPFGPLATQAYSTYSAGMTLDTATLRLYFQVLPIAPTSWETKYPNSPAAWPLFGIDDDGAIDCMFGGAGQVQATPTDTCIDTYVDRFLTQGVLFRGPTSAEHANLRALLVTALAAEGGDVTKRQGTLALVGQAAWLTSGALFRSELGSPGDDPAHRSRLSNEELGLAVGSMLSFHRPGAPMVNVLGNPWEIYPSSPDDLCDPWLNQISKAIADGSIQDQATIKQIVTAYGGGYDDGSQPLVCRGGTTPPRRDLSFELCNGVQLPARGQYWLAPRIAGFFREWLAYGSADSVFKDTPGLTSKYPDSNALERSYSNLQTGAQKPEADLVSQMDDTIARAVLDAAQKKQDVFKALMTTTTFHLPSTVVDSNGMSCTSDSDCPATYKTCYTEAGLCAGSAADLTIYGALAFGVDVVGGTPAARWVQMPANERSGVLTHPAWLAAHGDNIQDDPSLVHRGKWVRQNLLCETVPGLDLVMVIAKVGLSSPTLSARDRVEAAINQNPTCQGCHRLMNPLGYPFEMYNHAGFLRQYDKLDPDGMGQHQPDATSVIDNAPDPALNVAVQNAIDFTQRLGDSPYARRCFIRQAFRYFMGRDETMADQCTLAAMEAALDQGSFFDMLGVLASSDSVIYRTPQGGQP